ncbi:MAG TPA: cation transporter [Dermatophilaceae bacterium]|jgi:divalent metal cation (Fe/Co/Zn/Cd) transporter|nr:cation transporter [Dermatophilaceae bacterium]
MTASGGIGTRPADRRRLLGKRAQLLAAASVSYNLIEAAVSIAAGVVAGSVALVGFGLDSLVEVSSGLVILWQFHHRMPETRERQALRLIAFSFFGLAAYVTVESVRNLFGAGEAAPSPVGIAIATASLIVMPFLSWAQRRTGRELGSGSVVADSKQTLLCTYLSAVLLAGLVLNATLGWGWADPLAGLVIAGVAAREGLQAWRGESCGCGPAFSAGSETELACGCGPGCTDSCCSPQPRARRGHAESTKAGAVERS